MRACGVEPRQLVEKQDFRLVRVKSFNVLAQHPESLCPIGGQVDIHAHIRKGIMEILKLFLGISLFFAGHAESEPAFKHFLDEESLPDAAAAIDGDELRTRVGDVVVKFAFFLFASDD